MALTPRTFTLSALEVELGIDRRTLGKRLANVRPASSRGKSKRWRLADVLGALERDPVGGRAPVPAFREVPDRVRQVAMFLTATEENEIFPWDCAVDLEEYARGIGLDVYDLIQWAPFGLPLLPPKPGDEALRICTAQANRWRLLMGIFIEINGGDGLGDIAAEMRRLVGVA